MKLYAGSIKKPLLGLAVDHATGAREDVGDDAVEPTLDATSYSARRQDSEQYTFPSVCLSQARQNECDQSISKFIMMVCGLRKSTE